MTTLTACSTFQPTLGAISTTAKVPSCNMKQTAAIILGGGQGTRLFPLTLSRCKPAMYFGGKYRLIDVPISNSIHSGCKKIYVITQYLSSSLHQHIFKTYSSAPCSSTSIELLTSEEKPDGDGQFYGTADAVRKNISFLLETAPDYFFVLSGDQLYHMDLQKMLQVALDTNAELVIASTPIAKQETRRFGILQANEDNFVTKFVEKPQNPENLDCLILSQRQREHWNINQTDKYYLGSMGIYLFKKEALCSLLQEDPREDFGKHLIPTQVSKGKVAVHIHQGYWEDIGTVGSYYGANIALTHPFPAFNCYKEDLPIFTSPTHLPGASIRGTRIQDSIICEGSIVQGDEITNSILGQRTCVHQGVVIHGSYIMGNDHYCTQTPFSIGENSVIKNAVIDKNVRIGKGVQLINKNKLSHYDGESIYIREGVIVVSQGANICDGYVL